MKLGASHFLIHSIALELQADGVPRLNFGAADLGTGLARFKRDFGTHTVHLPSAVCYVGPLWRRTAYRTLELARTRQRAWRRTLHGPTADASTVG
jgi:lipid II:glycine glycyltransferase (peptidoglycan interpeptide bridge formation enzyme)